MALRSQVRRLGRGLAEAEEAGWRSTYLLSFFFIWPWSQVRTDSNHFCGGERSDLGMPGETRASLSALPSQPQPLTQASPVDHP